MKNKKEIEEKILELSEDINIQNILKEYTEWLFPKNDIKIIDACEKQLVASWNV